MRRVIAIVGATATGKTALGEALAEERGGEIVCADARQVFVELEIGTGKPTPAERAARPHHLFDLRRLEDDSSAGAWARAATAVCEDVWSRGALPILVGGSGLYIEALRHGLFAEPPRDAAVRERLREELAQLGPEALHARLAEIDPPTAARLAPRDGQRIARALEVCETSGEPMSAWHARPRAGALEAEWRVVEVTCPADELVRRIDSRTREMFAGGLVEETRDLVDRGYGEALRALLAIGYDEALEVMAGRLVLAEAIEQTSLRTRQLAKRQRTWFRHHAVDATVGVGGRDAASALSRLREAIDRAGD